MGGVKRKRRRGDIFKKKKKGQYYKSNRLFFFLLLLSSVLGYFLLLTPAAKDLFLIERRRFHMISPRALSLLFLRTTIGRILYTYLLSRGSSKEKNWSKMIRYCVCTYTAVHFDVFIVSSLLLPLYSACWYKIGGRKKKASPFSKYILKIAKFQIKIFCL